MLFRSQRPGQSHLVPKAFNCNGSSVFHVLPNHKRSRLKSSLVIVLLAVICILLILFVTLRLKGVHQISPMEAIRGQQQEEKKTIKKRMYWSIFPARGLTVYLAMRQLMFGKRRYIGACMVAVLLVFFASLAGRMNDWLSADGQGMMDAFNPADLDLGIQALGELSQEEMESVVINYSNITDSYEQIGRAHV